MNARKDRYAVRISEASYAEMQQKALQDGARQGVAVALVAIEKALGWRTVRLKRIFDGVQELLQMPSVLGKEITADDAIRYLRSEYGIDVDDLSVNVDINYTDGSDQK